MADEQDTVYSLYNNVSDTVIILLPEKVKSAARRGAEQIYQGMPRGTRLKKCCKRNDRHFLFVTTTATPPEPPSLLQIYRRVLKWMTVYSRVQEQQLKSMKKTSKSLHYENAQDSQLELLNALKLVPFV